MSKQEFLQKLKTLLSEYPPEEVNKSIGYYTEMMEECIEDGMSEDEAVASFGSIDEIVKQIKCELPNTSKNADVTENKKKRNSIPIGIIILLVISSPLWIAVLLLVFGLVFMVYTLIWMADLMLWITLLMLACFVLCGIAGFVSSLLQGAIGSALVYLGASSLCGGLSIFLFFGIRAVTKGILLGTKYGFSALKQLFFGKKKEEA